MNNAQASLTRWEHDDGTVILRGWMTPDCGKNGRPVIHFLHGTGLSSLTYWPFLASFHGEYDLFLGSFEGHGGSDVAPRERYSDWAALTARALICYEDLSSDWDPKQPVIALAHSFGAIATTLMLHKQRRLFDQYILLDPVIYPKSMIALMRFLHLIGVARRLPHVKQAKNRRQVWSSREDAHKNLNGRGVFKRWTDESLDSYIDHAIQPNAQGEWQLRCPPWLEARIFSGYPKKLWSALAQLPEYTHILHSTKTYPFIPPGVKKAEKANPHITLTEVEGGHCFMQEAPQESYQQIKRLLRF
ncbi:alpha/beta hydrolase [Neptunomonas antarctica]|uniref:Pimeloyl-ACP methyl ester carboxylesterase n=1 Tax=Neptunomonas antarctica TaxID=619304 RepID=A0A1N7P1I6_9GAMM|nr:alpha/beta hydrolase [Neptunomonas antarctica]SIT04433.1 Pimeloyl-ACP methyl ester carboxylesterase [Neptunomonas antarctica]